MEETIENSYLITNVSFSRRTQTLRMNNNYNRGFKLKSIRGPLSKEKMLRGPQFNGQKAYVGHKLLEKLRK